MNHVKTMAIRVATPADAEALLAVYAPYVQNMAVTFETAVWCATRQEDSKK